MTNSKTRRGVYINLAESDITYTDHITGSIYKFSSNKKLEMFKKQLKINFDKAEDIKIKFNNLLGYEPIINKSVLILQTYKNMRYK